MTGRPSVAAHGLRMTSQELAAGQAAESRAEREAADREDPR